MLTNIKVKHKNTLPDKAKRGFELDSRSSSKVCKGRQKMKIHLQQKESRALIPTDILFQTGFWSKVKSQLGWKPLAFDFASSDSMGDVLVLTRTFSNGISAAYVPQGPEFSPDPERYGLFLEALSNEMVRHLDISLAFIRYDLPWKSQYSTGTTVGFKGQRDSGRPETRLRELRMNFGTKSWNIRKAAVDLTVADTLVIDLTRTEQELLSDMKPKTRYNVRLALRKGVRVFKASEETLPAFYDLYRQTALRNGFHLCTYDHFVALFSALASNSSSPEVFLLLAAHNQDLLAGAIIVISGRTATYLFGASSNKKRNFMGPYAIQWTGIQLAREKGCLTYDMGAVAPTKDPSHPFYGMHRFKTGFGGNTVQRSGSWDYPLDSDDYNAFRNFETLEGSLTES